MIKKRTTFYLSDELLKMLKIRAIKTAQSTSEYVSQVMYQDLMEEQKDIKDIQAILKEPTIPFKKMLKQLKIEDEV